jgi:hypothetical protein
VEPVAVVAGDFNGDGKLELAVVDNYSHTVEFLLYGGSGYFQRFATYTVDASPWGHRSRRLQWGRQAGFGGDRKRSRQGRRPDGQR